MKASTARPELCCLCAPTASCTRDCPCSRKGKPCTSCAPGENSRCTNSICTHNINIATENERTRVRNRLRVRLNKPKLPYTPLHASPIGPLTQSEMLESQAAMKSKKTSNKRSKTGEPRLYCSQVTTTGMTRLLPSNRRMILLHLHHLLIVMIIMKLLFQRLRKKISI